MADVKQTERKAETTLGADEYARPEIFELGNAAELTRGFWVGAAQETVDPYARYKKILC